METSSTINKVLADDIEEYLLDACSKEFCILVSLFYGSRPYGRVDGIPRCHHWMALNAFIRSRKFSKIKETVF